MAMNASRVFHGTGALALHWLNTNGSSRASPMKRALICGISGQDGSYLAQLLLSKGYEVFGASRDAQVSSFANLEFMGIRNRISLVSVAVNDFRSVFQAISKIQPDETYNLAGQSSVGLSFEQPVETMESVSIGTLNLLEAIRFAGTAIKLYNAGSSECFGSSGEFPCNEDTPFRPRSPYAVAKAAAFWQVANYREAYDLFACTGILFNHESPLRQRDSLPKKLFRLSRELRTVVTKTYFSVILLSHGIGAGLPNTLRQCG